MLQLMHPHYSTFLSLARLSEDMSKYEQVIHRGVSLSHWSSCSFQAALAAYSGRLEHGPFHLERGPCRGYMTRGDTNKPETFEAVKQGCEEMLQLLKVGTAVGGNQGAIKGINTRISGLS